MIARMLYLKFLPEHIGEVKKLYREDIIPAIRQVKGFVDGMFLEPVNEGDDFIAFSKWKSLEEMVDYEQSPLYREQKQKVGLFLSREPVVKAYTFETIHTEELVM